MRYRKGFISISDSRDIPMLLLIRDSRAISSSQLIAELMLDKVESNSRSIHWRLNRLVANGMVQRLGNDRSYGEPVFSITHEGLSVLEYKGHALLALGSHLKSIVAEPEIPHTLELNAIRFSLKSSGLLVSWKTELQIISENLVDCGMATKDYDSVVTIRYDNRVVRFAIEYERTAKSAARYREICQTIKDDRATRLVLYLSANQEIMYLLTQELRSLQNKVAFGLASLFRIQQLSAPMVVIRNAPTVLPLCDILAGLPTAPEPYAASPVVRGHNACVN